MLTGRLISATVANKLPELGATYMNQNWSLRGPAKSGNTVHATVTIDEIQAERRRFVLSTVCRIKDVADIDDEALVKVE